MKAIAMKCTQEQFDAVMPRLENVFKIECFTKKPYLVNNLKGELGLISNLKEYGVYQEREIHETWNEKIFLEACGIEVMKPTLEEVKEYFKDADEVETISFEEKRKIDLDSITTDKDGDFWCVEKESGYVFFIGSNKKGFAKILTTKEKTFTITAKQLMQLENGFTLPKLKEWFPEVFDVKLEVGKWYKSDMGGLWYVEKITKNGQISFGINYEGRWIDSGERQSTGLFEATEQEVLEALKNEAVKMGFVEGNVFEGMEDSNCFYKCKGNIEIIPQEDLVNSMKGKTVLEMNGKDIFKNGIWAKVYQKL